MKNYNAITKFNIINNSELEIEYDNEDTFVYKNFIDLSINKYKSDLDCFTIVDKFEKLLEIYDLTRINRLFSIDHDQRFFENNMVWKMNLLQIEWSLTIYVIYEDKVKLV